MDTSTRNQYLALQSWVGDHTEGLGALLLSAASPGAALQLSAETLSTLPPRTCRALHKARRHWPRRNPDAPAPASDVHFLPVVDEYYPPALRDIPDPPPWLFCAGDPTCLLKPAVAVVGSRRASRDGLQAAGKLAERLAETGYTVCSGLALGIDGAAHRGALRSGTTVAVLASGIDRPSPQQHRSLATHIKQRGCIISELPPGTPPDRHRFPRRNRIISGLAATTVIVEAALPSGTLHTASAALEQGREVLVFPWSVYHRGGAGCLRLLRDGATPITSMEELPAHFPAMQSATTITPVLPAGDKGTVLSLIGDGALSADDLQEEMGVELSALLVVLAELELAGWVLREDGRYRRRTGLL